MLSSLRVRLPLLFLAGIVLCGARHDGDRGPALPGLRARPDAHRAAPRGGRDREALLERRRATLRQRPRAGAADVRGDEPRARDRRPHLLRRACTPFPGERVGPAAAATSRRSTGRSGETLTFEFTPPGKRQTYLAVAEPVVGSEARRSARSSSRSRRPTSAHRVRELVRRLAIAGALGLLVAGAARLVPLARGSCGPCSRSRARPTRSPAGNYDVELPRAGRARSATSPSGSARWPRGSPRPRCASGTSSCRSRTSCARR